MRRRSWSEIYRDLHNLPFDPNDFDVILGVPRSGLLLALMIAEAHDIQAYKVRDIRSELAEYWSGTVLVVDDSMLTGERFWEMVDALVGVRETYVYLVDASCERLPDHYTMKTSEWVLLPWDEHDDKVIALDMDGVLGDKHGPLSETQRVGRQAVGL